MAEQTAISWCDHTFSHVIGCTKVSEGCRFCYAESLAKRFNQAAWGPEGTRIKTSDAYWRQPLKWDRQAQRDGVRRRVFCASMADVFEGWEGPIVDHHGNRLAHCGGVFQPASRPEFSDWDPATMDDVRRDLFRLIDATPHLDWILLTKRPENIRFYRPNVWLGASVSDQATADRNVPLLLQCRDLCAVLFVICEPLLGPVDLTLIGETTTGVRRPSGTFHPLLRYDALRGHEDCGDQWYGKIDWVIVGGESGPHYRPMELDWARSLRDQCRSAGVPFFFKQSAALRPGQHPELDGEVIQEFPQVDR